ncbi:unnamed protein product [Caenorhabditis bovis]|uniref:Poly [ADP-ribose] polymerase n=1 Tax=Caenorhabditis bovis TaxID=2654633 RepID=A0A8S1F4U6_9PELO|nr:unnamed protein product [Caenorhabditis bovis]
MVVIGRHRAYKLESIANSHPLFKIFQENFGVHPNNEHRFCVYQLNRRDKLPTPSFSRETFWIWLAPPTLEARKTLINGLDANKTYKTSPIPHQIFDECAARPRQPTDGVPLATGGSATPNNFMNAFYDEYEIRGGNLKISYVVRFIDAPTTRKLPLAPTTKFSGPPRSWIKAIGNGYRLAAVRPEIENEISRCLATKGPFHNFSLKMVSARKMIYDNDGMALERVANIDERILLWHGTPNSRVESILNEGLQIQNRRERLQFGNGVYFANLAAKAARFSSRGSPTQSLVLLLCEVDVRQAVSLTKTDYEAHEKCKKVAKVSGIYSPIQTTIIENVHCYRDGIIVKNQGCLNYDEFVVFDPNLIRIRYVVEFQIVK